MRTGSQSRLRVGICSRAVESATEVNRSWNTVSLLISESGSQPSLSAWCTICQTNRLDVQRATCSARSPCAMDSTMCPMWCHAMVSASRTRGSACNQPATLIARLHASPPLIGSPTQVHRKTEVLLQVATPDHRARLYTSTSRCVAGAGNVEQATALEQPDSRRASGERVSRFSVSGCCDSRSATASVGSDVVTVFRHQAFQVWIPVTACPSTCQVGPALSVPTVRFHGSGSLIAQTRAEYHQPRSGRVCRCRTSSFPNHTTLERHRNTRAVHQSSRVASGRSRQASRISQHCTRRQRLAGRA